MLGTDCLSSVKLKAVLIISDKSVLQDAGVISDVSFTK